MSSKKVTGKTSVKMSNRLLRFLEKEGQFKETYEDVIWRLLGQKALTKEQKQEVKPVYEQSL
jgi:hypothetical protein